MPALPRPTKITFAEMRDMGVRGVLIYCSDYKCSHSIAISADPWPDDVRLSDLEARFVCSACGKRGADVGPAASALLPRTDIIGLAAEIGRGSNWNKIGKHRHAYETTPEPSTRGVVDIT
jgi:hypothetical protein